MLRRFMSSPILPLATQFLCWEAEIQVAEAIPDIVPFAILTIVMTTLFATFRYRRTFRFQQYLLYQIAHAARLPCPLAKSLL